MSAPFRKIIFTAIFVFAFCLVVSARDIKDAQCPKITVIGPDSTKQPGEPFSFTGKVVGDVEKSDISYFWTVSKGKILKGQNTSKIELTTTEDEENSTVNATLKIIGLPENCPNSATDIAVIASLPIGEPVESFGKIDLEDYKYRLDNFFIYLNQSLYSEGLIEIKFNRQDSQKYKISLLNEVNQFFEFRKYDKTRITFAISEGDYERTELWIVPQGAKFPKSRTETYERISEKSYKIVKAEDLEQKINEIFPKNKKL